MFNYLFGGVQDARMADPVNRALFSFLNNGLPVINEDGYDYVRNAFLAVGPVYECVDLISKKIAKMPVIIYKVVDKKKLNQSKTLIWSDSPSDRAKGLALKAKALEEVDIKSIRDLLDKPNDKQSWSDFVGILTHLYLIDGNGFAYGNGADKRSNKFTEMFALPFTSKEMNIVAGGPLEPIKGYNAVWNGNSELSFPFPNQILHLKTINPQYSINGSQMYGVSPLRPYVYQIVRDRLGNKQANKILNNGGVMGMLAPKEKIDELTPTQKHDLKERMLEAHTSSEALSRIVPSSIAMEWLQFGLPSTELQILDLVKATREDIYRAYHVPLSYASTDANTLNNSQTHGKQLMYNAVVPISDYIGEKLTSWICSAYKDAEYIIELDYLSSMEMSGDMAATVAWLDKVDYITPNEKREVIRWGRMDYQNNLMDKVYMSKQKAPIEKL